MSQRTPGKMSNAVGTRPFVPKKNGIRTCQPVVVHGLHNGNASARRSPVDTRTQQGEDIVHMNDVGREARERITHQPISTNRPNRPKPGTDDSEQTRSIQFAVPYG